MHDSCAVQTHTVGPVRSRAGSVPSCAACAVSGLRSLLHRGPPEPLLPFWLAVRRSTPARTPAGAQQLCCAARAAAASRAGPGAPAVCCAVLRESTAEAGPPLWLPPGRGTGVRDGRIQQESCHRERGAQHGEPGWPLRRRGRHVCFACGSCCVLRCGGRDSRSWDAGLRGARSALAPDAVACMNFHIIEPEISMCPIWAWKRKWSSRLG